MKTDEAKALVERLRIDIDGGKYTLVAPSSGAAYVLRYGEPWLSELPVGASCWMEMAYELEEKRDLIETQAREIGRLREALQLLHDNIVAAWPSLSELGPVANARAALGERQ